MRLAITTEYGIRGLQRKTAQQSRKTSRDMRGWKATGLLTRTTISGMVVIQDAVNRFGGEA